MSRCDASEGLKELRKELVDVRAELWSTEYLGPVSRILNLERRECDLEKRIKEMEKKANG